MYPFQRLRLLALAGIVWPASRALAHCANARVRRRVRSGSGPGLLVLFVLAVPSVRGQVAAPAASPERAPAAVSSSPPSQNQTPGANAAPQETAPAAGPSASSSQGPQPGAPPAAPSAPPPVRPSYGQQPKRIMGFMPNIRAVSVGAHVAPPTFKEKFKLATENSFDYSGFVSIGFETVLSYAQRSYPQLGSGAEAFGQYYWRAFADRTIGNYLTNAIIPSLTAEDTRYYTMGRGRWYKRLAYAYSRVFITPNNNGNSTINLSEILGKGAAAGLGNLYYPGGPNWRRTGERWAIQVGALDAGYDVFREFWPDISAHVLHRHRHDPQAGN